MRGLEVDRQEAKDVIHDLEMQVKSREEEVAKEYVALLEDWYAEATAKSIWLEGQVTTL